MIVRLEPITASVVAVMGWAWNTATAAPLRRGAAIDALITALEAAIAPVKAAA